MNNLTNKLTNLKESLQSEKEKQAVLNGRLQNYMEELEKNHNCNTIEQSQEKINLAGSRLETIQSNLNNMVNAFEEKYKL